MLIHLTPTLKTCPVSGHDCRVLDLVIPEFQVRLEGGIDIVARRPHPNKTYLVVTPQSSRRALVGILLDVAQPVKRFVCTTRWDLKGGRVAEHAVTYEIVDEDYDAATARMCLWNASSEHPDFESRWIKEHEDYSPMQAEPRMYVGQSTIANSRQQKCRMNPQGYLDRVEDTFKLPTIQRERLNPATCTRYRQPGPDTRWVL